MTLPIESMLKDPRKPSALTEEPSVDKKAALGTATNPVPLYCRINVLNIASVSGVTHSFVADVFCEASRFLRPRTWLHAGLLPCHAR